MGGPRKNRLDVHLVYGVLSGREPPYHCGLWPEIGAWGFARESQKQPGHKVWSCDRRIAPSYQHNEGGAMST